MHIRLYPCVVCACECGCLQRPEALGLLGAELNGDYELLPWVLGTELRFSAKVVCASNCGTTSWLPGNDSCFVEQGTGAGINKVLFSMLLTGVGV